jgi:hypothetical protein
VSGVTPHPQHCWTQPGGSRQWHQTQGSALRGQGGGQGRGRGGRGSEGGGKGREGEGRGQTHLDNNKGRCADLHYMWYIRYQPSQPSLQCSV